MNAELLNILDRALSYSTWVFLGALIVFLFFSSLSLRRRKRKLGDLYESGFENGRRRKIRLPASSRYNQWRISMNSLLLALGSAVLFFVVFVFTPLPFFDNFAASEAWQVTPLRVTAISFDRFYEGFSIEGEVWNQSPDAIPELKAWVKVVGIDDKPLDEVEAPVTPLPLESGKAGVFTLDYEEHSPFIKGFTVSFTDGEGNPIAHVSGFDVQ